jgi:hypothetical protein
MKRLAIVLMITGLVAGSVATVEAKEAGPFRVERTVKASYAPPYVPPITGCKSALGPWACLLVTTRSNEAFFTARVEDAHGQPVFVWWSGSNGASGTFCGETAQPIPITPDARLEFRIGIDWPGQLECLPHKVKTIGTISVTLSNLP